jgi:4-hydroxy-L-threonine phosphate dehydrogenase PdxA
MTIERPIIAVTMGDAAGIGPEVIIKALAFGKTHAICRPLVIGESSIMQEAINLIGKPLKLHPIRDVDKVKGEAGTIDLFDLYNIDWAEVTLGQICPACGH